MFSVFYQQDFTKALFIRCLFMQRVLQVPCNGRPSLLSRLAKKGGSVGNTRLSLPHAKMLLVPLNCFLCRVDYALEENVLTEPLIKYISYWEVVTRILIFSGRHDLPSDAIAFSFLAPLEMSLHCGWLRILGAAPRKYQLNVEIVEKWPGLKLSQNKALWALLTKSLV